MIRVIRAREGGTAKRRPHPHGRRVIKPVEQRAQDRAETILTQARRTAETELNAAKEQARKILGKSADEAKAEAVKLLLEAKKTCDELHAQHRRELTDLAVRIAEKLLGRELELAPQAICGVVEQGIARAPKGQPLRIRLHPEDVKGLLRAKKEGEGMQLIAEEQLEVDESLSRGGCVIEMPVGEMDLRLETRVEAVLAALQE